MARLEMFPDRDRSQAGKPFGTGVRIGDRMMRTLSGTRKTQAESQTKEGKCRTPIRITTSDSAPKASCQSVDVWRVRTVFTVSIMMFAPIFPLVAYLFSYYLRVVKNFVRTNKNKLRNPYIALQFAHAAPNFPFGTPLRAHHFP